MGIPTVRVPEFRSCTIHGDIICGIQKGIGYREERDERPRTYFDSILTDRSLNPNPSMDSENATPASSEKPLEVDYLIAGTGPAGASLACFLAYHGKVLQLVAGPGIDG